MNRSCLSYNSPTSFWDCYSYCSDSSLDCFADIHESSSSRNWEVRQETNNDLAAMVEAFESPGFIYPTGAQNARTRAPGHFYGRV